MDSKCLHKNWRALGRDIVGFATCLDCGEKFPIHDLLNGTLERIFALEKRLEDKVSS